MERRWKAGWREGGKQGGEKVESRVEKKSKVEQVGRAGAAEQVGRVKVKGERAEC
ncbi:MAG: hypothetical protein OCU12_03405 [Methanophagales archaeon]|nr:hypothetical protein [Methanophagales archaeon]